MNDNKNDSSVSNIENLKVELANLLAEAKKINFEIEVINKQSRNDIQELDSKIETTVKSIERLVSKINYVEKEAGDEFDAIVLKQVEEVA
jgi:hypothetical protein